MQLANKVVRLSWLAHSSLKRREKEGQREPMRMNSLSAPLHLCDSISAIRNLKKELANFLAPERRTTFAKFGYSIQVFIANAGAPMSRAVAVTEKRQKFLPDRTKNEWTKNQPSS